MSHAIKIIVLDSRVLKSLASQVGSTLDFALANDHLHVSERV